MSALLPSGALALRTDALPALAGALPVPAYDRSRVVPSIVHIGVGAFHRAHQAVYLDRLMNEGRALEWGVRGVGVLPGDRRTAQALWAQDCLYTQVVKHPDGSVEGRVVGSIVDYLLAPHDPEAVIEALAADTTRIVSLTVTEGGYHVSPVTGELDAARPALAADLRPGAVPTSAFGLLTEALARRRDRGRGPLTVMSCDNIPGNGQVARRMLSAFARLRDRDLGAWIDGEVAFPDSMVDRITPVTSDEDRALVTERFGLADLSPVVCEPYTQWVLEDHFAAGRPPLEEAGVQVVPDVQPYELMKLRLLNASHQALCYLGYLSGYRYAHEVCSDPLFVRFLLGYMDDEATPTLPVVPGVDLASYKRTLLERFANPAVRDTLARLCAESSDRIPKWLVPVVRAQLDRGGEVHRAALVVAAWTRYAEGVDQQGDPIQVVDRLRDQVVDAARRSRRDPTAFLEQRDLFGELVESPRFVESYVTALASLREVGARATLERWSDRP